MDDFELKPRANGDFHLFYRETQIGRLTVFLDKWRFCPSKAYYSHTILEGIVNIMQTLPEKSEQNV
jgi:hypothetical protein